MKRSNYDLNILSKRSRDTEKGVWQVLTATDEAYEAETFILL